MKWIGFLVVLAGVLAICWYTGLIKSVGGPFKFWLHWIGAQ